MLLPYYQLVSSYRFAISSDSVGVQSQFPPRSCDSRSTSSLRLSLWFALLVVGQFLFFRAGCELLSMDCCRRLEAARWTFIGHDCLPLIQSIATPTRMLAIQANSWPYMLLWLACPAGPKTCPATPSAKLESVASCWEIACCPSAAFASPPSWK